MRRTALTARRAQADTALELAAEGLADTYSPFILRGRLDPRLRAVSFDPPLVDLFALVMRRGSRLARPVAAFVDRFTAHLADRTDPGRSRSNRS